MIPHIQTDTDEVTGTCFPTCIASVLDLPLDEVPNFRQMQQDGVCNDMVWEADKWLRENHNKRFITVEMFRPEPPDRGGCQTSQCIMNRMFHQNRDELVLLFGLSPRQRKDGGKKYHCVVGRADCWGFELVHDPYPEGGGIVGQPYGILWIVKV